MGVQGPRRFVNWAGTVVSTPREWHAPASEDEIVDLVRGARGRRLRIVGAAHSWSRVAAPEDIAVSLDRFAGVVELDGRQITVRAGTRLRDLNAHLAAAGLALPIVGSISEQSIGGLIATGTHGSSLVHGNLASLVVRLRLVTGRGERCELAASDPRLDGARVHLGALGVVTQVTLPVEPAFRLAETVENVPIAGIPGALESIARGAEYVKVWWFPHTSLAQVYRYARTSDPTSTGPSPATARWIDERIVNGALFPLVLGLERLRPAWIPPINRVVAKVYLDRPRRVGPGALMLSTPMPPVHRETEAAVPLARAGDALDRVLRAIDRDRLHVNFPIEVRFVRGDGGWMSPAHGADTVQIGAYCAGPGTDAYFTAFWRELRAIGARPHWGKELDHTAEEVRALWPLAPRFLALRDELDPDRVFAGAFHARTLGP